MPVGVFCVECMTVNAVCNQYLTSSGIFSTRYRFQVVRSDTIPVSTYVVKVESWRDFTDHKLISKTMRTKVTNSS